MTEPNYVDLLKPRPKYKDGMRICSSCDKAKPDDQFMDLSHKTCEKCIMRVRTWERKNRRAYFGHML